MINILLVLLLLFGMPTLVLGQPVFKVMTEALPPFNFTKNDQVVGISADIVRQLFSELNWSFGEEGIRMYPWVRAYQVVQQEPGTILFSAARTAEREKLFKWVGPLYQVEIGLIAKKERNLSIAKVEDLAGYRIGTVRDGAPEQLLIKAGVDPERLDRLAKPAMNILKLTSGRIDLFCFNLQTTQYLMLKNGIDPSAYETVFNLKQPNLYIALHKDTDPALVNALQAALDQLKTSPATGQSRYNQIVEKYLGP